VRVTSKLDAMVRLYGKPGDIVSDNGTELISRAMLERQNEKGVHWQHRTRSLNDSTANCTMSC